MMKRKRYEVIEDGILYPQNSFEKSREGLAEAYERASEILTRGDKLRSLDIQCTTYDSIGRILECEMVDDLLYIPKR